MRHFKLTIAYDGTEFHGWQIQANKPTIQGEIVDVLRRITQESVQLHGAGRTDAISMRGGRRGPKFIATGFTGGKWFHRRSGATCCIIRFRSTKTP